MHFLLSMSQILEWVKPKKSNGKLTTYIVKAYISSANAQLLKERNYCDERKCSGRCWNYCIDFDRIFFTSALGPADYKIPTLGSQPAAEVQPSPKPDPTLMCNCVDDENSDRTKSPQLQPAEAEQIIEFEDAIQNIIYVR